MYGEKFRVLQELADEAFGAAVRLIRPDQAESGLFGQDTSDERSEVVVFGKHWGKELPLPKPAGSTQNEASKFYVDWILAKLDKNREIEEIIAVEVQTIDTTGSYRDQADRFFEGIVFSDKQGRMPGYSNSGMNWENVNKRILPQLIYKGHVLRRESKCKKGLYFVCPMQVYERLFQRLGGSLHDYDPGQGTITFRSYELKEVKNGDQPFPMKLHGQFTTTVDQVALAFTSPGNLPDRNVYEAAIQSALQAAGK